jgi:hypothetical protein
MSQAGYPAGRGRAGEERDEDGKDRGGYYTRTFVLGRLEFWRKTGQDGQDFLGEGKLTDYRIFRIKRDGQDFSGEGSLTGCPGWAGCSGKEKPEDRRAASGDFISGG